MGISNPFKSIEKKIKRGIESLGNDIKRGINNLGNEVKGSINKAGNDVKNGIHEVASQAENQVKNAAHDVESQLKSSFEELEDELEEAAKDAFEAVKDEAMELAQAAMKEISKGALNKAVDAIQIVVPKSISLGLGPIGLEIGDINDKIDTFQKWASNPPSTKNDIRAIVEQIAPSSVSITISIGLAFLVVQSESLELEVGATYETSDFLDNLDVLLGHWGINI